MIQCVVHLSVVLPRHVLLNEFVKSLLLQPHSKRRTGTLFVFAEETGCC